MRYQRTISRTAFCKGIGLHTGEPAALRFIPAPADAGIVFIRKTHDHKVRVRAEAANVVSTNFSTALGSEGVCIQTVEHLLAALSGLQIDNLYIEVEGPEIPIMDGSAWPFVKILRGAGVKQQGRIRPAFTVREPILIREENRWIHVAPLDHLSVTYTMPFDHPLLGVQIYSFDDDEEVFTQEISRARTFGFLKDEEKLRSVGLIKGASLENAVVIGEQEIINEGGVRYADEMVRHKVLDLIGDLALLGRPLLGKVTVHQGGHSLHTQLVSALLEREEAWSPQECPEVSAPVMVPSR